MLKIGPAANVHVQAGDGQAMTVRAAEAIIELLMPDAVLRLLAAGVRFLTMPMAEAGVDPQRDVPPGRSFAELVDHVERAAIDVEAELDDRFQRFAVKNVGGVDD